MLALLEFLAGLGELWEWLKDGSAGWRYLFSGAYRQKIHAGWRYESRGYIILNVLGALGGMGFTLLVAYVIVALFAGWNWLLF